MSGMLSQARISRRTVLRGGALCLAAVCGGLSACSPPPGTIWITFLYSTEKNPWIEPAIQTFNNSNQQYNGKQIQVLGYDSGSLDIVNQILNQQFPDLVACSPASGLELSRLDYLWKKKYGQSIVDYSNMTMLAPQSLVQSPLVFAIWKVFADPLHNAYGHITWDTLYKALQLPNGWIDLGHPELGPQIHLGQTLPTESNSGLLSITLMAAAYLEKNHKPLTMLTANEVKNDPGLWNYIDVFERQVNAYGKSTGTYWDRVIELGYAQYAIIFTYESLVLLYNQKRRPDQMQIEMFYPELNVLSDHPFAILNNTRLKQAGTLPEQQLAARAFRDFLLGHDQQKAALQYGFRPADSTQPLADSEKNDPNNPFDQLKPTAKVSSLSPEHALDTGIPYLKAPGGDVADALITKWNSIYSNP